MRILYPENPRFPPEGSSAEGKSGPKARPKGVVDGQRVNIPVQPIFRPSKTFRLRGCKLRLRSRLKEFNEICGANSGGTHHVSLSVLKNSRISSKFML